LVRQAALVDDLNDAGVIHSQPDSPVMSAVYEHGKVSWTSLTSQAWGIRARERHIIRARELA